MLQSPGLLGAVFMLAPFVWMLATSVKPPEAVAERLVDLLGEQFASPHRERVNQAS